MISITLITLIIGKVPASECGMPSSDPEEDVASSCSSKAGESKGSANELRLAELEKQVCVPKRKSIKI